jgi:hypothetical protein
MPIVLKLVGFNQHNQSYQIEDTFFGMMNLTILQGLFGIWGLDDEELSKVKFIINTEQINNIHQNFEIKENEEKTIFVFTSDTHVRFKLFDIFKKQIESLKADFDSDSKPEPKSSININKPITQSQPDTTPKLTQELIDVMNVKSVSLFADKDFKNLISVYLTRPDLFNTFAQYVQNGNIVQESLLPSITKETLTNAELTRYLTLVDKIDNLDTGVNRDQIFEQLIKYSGHLNLTLRAILCENVVKSSIQ